MKKLAEKGKAVMRNARVGLAMSHRKYMIDYNVSYKPYEEIDLFELNVWKAYDEAVGKKMELDKTISESKCGSGTKVIR